MSPQPCVQYADSHWVMPGMATAHSHAFQRVLRGRTQRRSMQAASFWGWRDLMYTLAAQVDPDDMYAIARFAYTELAMSGVTAVGEFHYVHHDLDGNPYTHRTELADAVIRAAKDTGIRICLIRTAYMRGGHKKPLDTAQKRFADSNVDLILQDLDTLQAQYKADPMVTVAVAAHSIRAVPLPQIRMLAAYADQHRLPFHMHVCEQRRELEECKTEYGTTPITLLANEGILSRNFVAVHATHLTPAEITALGSEETFVCLCRTTERDLGDGLPQTSDLLQAGVRLCVGVDSHACENAFEEVRAVEYDERSRMEERHSAAEAPLLLDAATRLGYAACGLDERWTEDRIYLDAEDPSIAVVDKDHATDAIIFGATPRAVKSVVVAGQTIIEAGCHLQYHSIYKTYRDTLRKLALI